MFRGAVYAAPLVALLGALAVSAVPARAQQFSADIVRTDAAGVRAAGPGKLYVSGNKVRIELSDARDGYFVVDAGVPPVSYFVRPGQRVYMDSRQSSRLTQFLVPVDVTDPCRQWQSMADIAEPGGSSGTWRCERGDQQVFKGRVAIKYLASSSKDRQIRAWIDPQLKWPVSLTLADGTVVDLENIREQPQSADLFVIPADYSKFDPRALIERIKQSDVWVEPQH